MKKEDVKIGMKVVPHNKTVGDIGLNNSNVWKNAQTKGQPYLYVSKIDNMLFSEYKGSVLFLSLSEDRTSNDYFNFSDVEPYIEESYNKTLLNKFLNSKAVINCRTEEEAIELLNYLNDLGYKWTSGSKASSHTNYEMHKENTCYNIEEKGIKEVYFSRLGYYQCEGYEIIKYSDLKGGNEMKKSDLKTGMFVEYRNGRSAMVACNFEGKEDTYLLDAGGHMKLSSYKENLKLYDDSESDWDIMKVYKPNYTCKFKPESYYTPIWVRKDNSAEIVKVKAEIEKAQEALKAAQNKLTKLENN